MERSVTDSEGFELASALVEIETVITDPLKARGILTPVVAHGTQPPLH